MIPYPAGDRHVVAGRHRGAGKRQSVRSEVPVLGNEVEQPMGRASVSNPVGQQTEAHPRPGLRNSRHGARRSAKNSRHSSRSSAGLGHPPRARAVHPLRPERRPQAEERPRARPAARRSSRRRDFGRADLGRFDHRDPRHIADLFDPGLFRRPVQLGVQLLPGRDLARTSLILELQHR